MNINVTFGIRAYDPIQKKWAGAEDYIDRGKSKILKNGEVIYSGAAENMPADTYYDKVLKIVSGKIALNVVLFPAPFLPMSPVTQPFSTCNEQSNSNFSYFFFT